MHEAGIAQSILETAARVAKEHSATKITLIKVRVGKMSAIDEASLRFAFEALKAGSMAENAEFEYEAVKLMGKCTDCSETSELEGFFVSCPKCGGAVTIVSGSELEIAHIDIE